MATQSAEIIAANDVSPTVFEVDYEFTWNTGQQTQYWYQIIGSLPSETNVVSDPSNPCLPVQCCTKMLIQIHADSLTSLCSQLQARGWTYPIQSVTKYSLPADSAAAAAVLASGNPPACLFSEVVDLCQIPACASFCINFDVVECICVTTTPSIQSASRAIALSLTSLRYQKIGGGVKLKGRYKTRNYQNGEIHSAKARGGVKMGGCFRSQKDTWVYRTVGQLQMQGRFRFRSPSFHVKVGGTPVWTESVPMHFLRSDVVPKSERSWQIDDMASVDLGLGAVSELLVMKSRHNISPNVKLHGIELEIERSAVGTVRERQISVVMDGEYGNLAHEEVTWPIGIPSRSNYRATISDSNARDVEVGIQVYGANHSPKLSAKVHKVSARLSIQAETMLVLGDNNRFKFDQYHHKMIGGILLGERLGYHVEWRYPFRPKRSVLLMSGGLIQKFYDKPKGNLILGDRFVSKCDYYRPSTRMDIGLQSANKYISNTFHPTVGGKILLEDSSLWTHVLGAEFDFNLRIGDRMNSSPSFRNLYRFKLGDRNRFRNSYYRARMKGGVAFHNQTKTKIGSHGTIVMSMKMSPSAKAKDVRVQFKPDAKVRAIAPLFTTPTVTVGTITPTTSTVVACACSGMPLSLPMSQSIGVQNKLSEFAQRNNITLLTTYNLQYTALSQCWMANTHYQGYSSVSNTSETWGIIYDLECTTNVGGTDVGVAVWKFSMRVAQKKLSTGQTLETRLVVTFLPDTICAGGTGFNVGIVVDVVQNSVVITPAATLYQFVLYDNLGLFKTPYWLANPKLDFVISQTGLSSFAPRVSLNLGVHS